MLRLQFSLLKDQLVTIYFAILIYDTGLPPLPGVYPGMAQISCLAVKNTDVGAGAVDIDYRSNLKIVFINHSNQYHLHIESVEDFHIKPTERNDKDF